MAQGENTRPRSAGVPEELKPYAAALGVVSLFGTPAEVAVPIARRLRGRSGVSTAPGLVNLVNGVIALGVAHVLRRRPAQWARWRHRHIPRWAPVVGLGYLTLSPAAAAAAWHRAVVLPQRSPLWGGFVSPLGLLQVAVGLVALHRIRTTTPRTSAERDGAPR